MENKKKHNLIFVLIILITILTCFVIDGMSHLRNNPFTDKIEMQNLVKSVHSDKHNLMIVDGGMTIVVLDEDMNYKYSIEGGLEEGGFYTAYDAIYTDDYIYVADEYDMARIARFTADGKFDSYVYQGESIITSLQLVDKDIWISEVSDEQVTALKIDYDGKILAKEKLETEYKALEIADCDVYFDNQNNAVKVALATRNGNVYTIDNSGTSLTYDATVVECKEYYSLALELAYDNDGTLYINDLGTRTVYKADDNKISAVIEKGENSGIKAGSISEYPIYNGLNVYGSGNVSVISTEYYYNEEFDSYDYKYVDYTKNIYNNNVIFNGNFVMKSSNYMIKSYITVVAVVLLIVCLVYSIIRFIRVLKEVKLEASTKIQFGVLFAAVAATIFTTSQLVSNYNKRYSDEVMDRIASTSFMMSQNLAECQLENIEAPKDCYGESWNEIDAVIQKTSDIENLDDVYFVIYKEIDGVISEIYSDNHIGFYPMAGIFENSIEQEIYETGNPYKSNSYSSADGSYMFVLQPVMNDSGEVIALLEVGTDLYAFNAENSEVVKNVLVYVFMSLTIALLILGEVIVSKSGLSDRRIAKKEKRPVSPAILRPLVFLIYFIANMSTAFAPLYGTQLWRESDPFSSEIAAALPLSAETISAAFAAMIAGFVCDKIGCKNISFASAVFYIIGNLMAACANNLYMFIGANIFTGIAGGLFAIAIDAYIAAFSDEEYRSKSFAGFNAALLAGINCGTVVGSMIAENLGFKNTYLVAACIIPIVVFLVAYCMQGRKYLSSFTSEESKENSDDTKSISIFRFICSPRVLLYFVMISFPYIVCASFLSYFFPIYGAESLLTETQISLAFLLSGVVSIYLGPILSDLISKRMGTYRSMVLASVIYASALLFFIMSPSILSCFIVVAMFAVADSFGLTAQSVYFTGLPEVKKLGNGKAMGINTTVENISSACGPMIFAYIFILGTEKGLMILAIGFVVMLALFAFMHKFFGKKL